MKLYSTKDVGAIIGEEDYTIRYWCGQLKSVLPISIDGGHRNYTQADVDKLKFVKELVRGNGLTLKQVVHIMDNPTARKLLVNDLGTERLLINALIERLQPIIDNSMKLNEQRVVDQMEEIKSMIAQEMTHIRQELQKYREAQNFLGRAVQREVKQQLEELRAQVNMTLTPKAPDQ